MDDYEFRLYLDACKYVSEETSFLEILNYSVLGSPIPQAVHDTWR